MVWDGNPIHQCSDREAQEGVRRACTFTDDVFPLRASLHLGALTPGASTLTWRIREAPQDKLRRHQLANHEPPRGLSNRFGARPIFPMVGA